MDFERNFFSSSASSAAAAEVEVTDGIELEAAEALADLAILAMRESVNSDTVNSNKWGSKGKRGKKRVKTESPLVDSFTEQVLDSAVTAPDLNMDSAVVVVDHHQRGESLCCNNNYNNGNTNGIVLVKPEKLEHDFEEVKSNHIDVLKTQPLCGGDRPRQNLTEEEKEERRLRRILANRESARQTIRRRQALCEDLSRKAADLAWENENLKREKDSVLKEFQSLESKNKYLKAQMARLIKTEVDESPADLKSVPDERSTNPATNCRFLLYNQHPFSALCWSSITQSPSPVQSHHGPQGAIVIPSNLPPQQCGKFNSPQLQHENCMVVNSTRTPLYIVPCPLFFPVSDNGNGSLPQPSVALNHQQDGTSVNNQSSCTSSSKAATLMENQLSSSGNVKSEAACSPQVRLIADLNETPVGFPPDGGGQCAVPYPNEAVIAPVTLGLGTPMVVVKSETGFQSDFVLNNDSTKSRQLTDALPGKPQGPFKFCNKNLADAAAAAVARKRRKELTKLKNIHGRQCRMNC